MPPFARPAWVVVDLQALTYNIRQTRRLLLPHQRLLAVVKANAYGHGAVKVSQVLQREGVEYLGVASLEEAIQLQDAGIVQPLLILGYTPPRYAPELAARGIHQGIFSMQEAEALHKELSGRSSSRKVFRRLHVHLKIDTGMGRLGVLPEKAKEALRKVQSLPTLSLKGIFTHLSSADCNEEFTKAQLNTFFQKVPRRFPGLLHAGNSAALLSFQDRRFHLFRVGILLYGYFPFPKNAPPPFFQSNLQLKPLLSLKAQLVSVKKVPQGTPVSYGATYWTHRPSVLGVVPAGYADGISRHLSNKLEVSIRGHRAKLVGRVCMDFSVLDLTKVPGVRVGDEVTLLGKKSDGALDADDWAELQQTISYEVLTGFHRLPCLYQHLPKN